MVYPTLLAAIGDVAHPSWRASSVGVHCLWRDLCYAVGALLAGLVADAFGVSGPGNGRRIRLALGWQSGQGTNMKLQLQENSLRLRLNESELAELLTGGPQRLSVERGGEPLLVLVVALGDDLGLTIGSEWRLVLPGDEVRRYVERLPTRESLVFALEGDLKLDFDVDVRDSVQVRGPRRHA